MAAKLQADQKLKRLIHVHSIPGEVEVTVTVDGIAFRVPGTKTSTTLAWAQAVIYSNTPTSVKSYHFHKSLDFLKSQAEKVIKKRAEKEQNGTK